MKNLGLVSVFMPTYNAEKFIIEAVESVIQQNYSNIELVISDDASKDETPTILNDLKDKYPNIIKLFLQQIEYEPLVKIINRGYRRNFFHKTAKEMINKISIDDKQIDKLLKSINKK